MTTYSTWLDFVYKNIIPEDMPEDIKESWQLSKKLKVPFDPSSDGSTLAAEIDEVLSWDEGHRKLMAPYIENLAKGIGELGSFAVFLLNQQGRILLFNTNMESERVEGLGIYLGSEWSIARRGTTAPGITLNRMEMAGIHGAAHYQKRYHDYLSIAAPIRFAKGEGAYVLGVLVEKEIPAITIEVLLTMGAQGIQKEIELTAAVESLQEVRQINEALVQENHQLSELKNQYQTKAIELELVINTISDGVAIINREGEYTLLNPACFEVVQYLRKGAVKDPMKGDNQNPVTQVEEITGVISAHGFPIKEILAGEMIQNYVFKIETEEGERYISFNGIPVFDQNGKVDYGVISLTDVTQIQQQQMTIHQNNQFMKGILESIGAPVVVINYPNCGFEVVNSLYCKFLEDITGMEQHEETLIGKTFGDLFSLGDSVLEDWYNMAHSVAESKKRIETRIIKFQKAQGKEQYLQIIYTPIMNKNDEVCYITAVGIDVTNQIKAKRDAEDLAKMKEEYFSVISHELRSPITVIHSAIQLLTGPPYYQEFGPASKKMLKKIEKNTYRLLRLVNNFLDITRAEAGYMKLSEQNIKLGEYTEALVESILPVAQQKHINLRFENHCKDLVISIDGEKYERILLNLISNAFKFTDSGGNILISLHELENHISLSVKDDGIGIPLSKQELIFDRFYIIDSSFSRGSEGTGIGLSLVKKFVEMMEGSVKVISQEGEGCEFIITLPKKLKEGSEDTVLNRVNNLNPEKIQTEFADIQS